LAAPREALLRALVELEVRFPWSLAGASAEARARLARSREAPQRALFAKLAALVHDLEALPTLLDWLEDWDVRVQRSALAALRRLSQADHGPGVESWRAWYQEEQDWSLERLPVLEEELACGDAWRASAALAELSRHPLQRHACAALVAENLVDLPAATLPVAAALLRGFGSRAALPALVRALEETSGTVCEIAWRTLCALEGLDLPSDPPRWRALLEGRAPRARISSD
jgi:hypothetical protein